ncbi:MAG: DUF3096 domain-containing protein [Neomegalonema sp.]|nr:DUF3096 domain-containing protein [Neomegalonema sp.]
MKKVPLTPALSIVVGVLIIIWPAIIAYVIGAYLIFTGALELSGKR